MQILFDPPSLKDLALRLVSNGTHRHLLTDSRWWKEAPLEKGAATHSPMQLNATVKRLKRDLVEVLRRNGLRVDIGPHEVRITPAAEFAPPYMDEVPLDQVPLAEGIAVLSASLARRGDGVRVFLCRTLPSVRSGRRRKPEVTRLRYVVDPATYDEVPDEWCLDDDIRKRLNDARHHPNHFEAETDAVSHAYVIRQALEYHRAWPLGEIPDHAFDEAKLARKRRDDEVDLFASFRP